ncbi:MAG: methyl-accepting chemotaxis protein [Myxococcota bacterium]
MKKNSSFDDVAAADMAQSEVFRRKFMTVVSGAIVILSPIVSISWWLAGISSRYWRYVALAGVVSAVSLALARSHRSNASVATMTYGIAAVCLGYRIQVEDMLFTRLAVEALIMLGVFSGCLAPRRINLGFATTGVIIHAITTYVEAGRVAEPLHAWSIGLGDVSVFVVTWSAATVAAGHLRTNDRALRARLAQIGDVIAQADRIATGDLSAKVEADDAVAVVVQRMQEGLRRIVLEVQDGVRVLGSSSSQVESMTIESERGAARQAVAVQQTTRTIEVVNAQARQIATASGSVLENAESTLAHSEIARARMKHLHDHSDRIEELLDKINHVARRSEILALNAALEGSRAGRAGRGFSLVAEQMKNLAGSTSSAVVDVKELITSVATSNRETALAVEATTTLAANTARSARAIGELTDEQVTTLQQVLEASSEISRVAQASVTGVNDTRQAIAGLHRLATRLDEAAHRFTV